MSSIFFGVSIFGQAEARTDRHVLGGTVTVDGVPARRLIVVLDRLSLSVIAATLSRADSGAWKIKGISEYPERQLLVLALDNTGNYNAEVADYISQVTG